MKIIKALLFLLSIAFTSYAQDYHIFRHNGNEGLTDNNGTEIIEPIYDKHNWLDKKNMVVMQPYTDYSTDKKLVLLFNCKTQEKTYYKTFNTDAVYIGTDTFSVVIDKNKKTFLWSESADKKIPLPGGDYYFKNVGSRYVVADYFPDHESEPVEIVKAKPVATKKITVANKRVIFKVPIVKYKLDTYDSYQQDYAVFANTGDFKKILSGKYTSYKPLYAVTDDGDPVSNYNEEASGILFSNGDMHTLYDSVMKKVSIFKMAVSKDFKDGNFLPDDEKALAILKKCSALLNTKVAFQFVGRVMMAREHERPERLKPKPILITTDTTDGTIVSVRDTTGIATQILFTKHKTEIDEKNNEISITIPGEKSTTDIYVDMDKKKIWLPVKYIKQLGLTVY